jgi:hypothetical protein
MHSTYMKFLHRFAFLFAFLIFALAAPTVLASGSFVWTDQTAAGTRGWGSITSSSDGTRLAAADSSPGDIFTSTDSGVHWTDQTAAGSRPWTTITSSSDGTKLAVATTDFSSTGDIYTSTDGGATWTDQTAAGSRFWSSITSSADAWRRRHLHLDRWRSDVDRPDCGRDTRMGLHHLLKRRHQVGGSRVSLRRHLHGYLYCFHSDPNAHPIRRRRYDCRQRSACALCARLARLYPAASAN